MPSDPWGELPSISVMDDLRAAAEALRRNITIPAADGENARRDMAAALRRQHYVMHSGDFHVGDIFEPAINLTEEQVRLARQGMELTDTIAMVARPRERRLSTPVAADWQPNAWEA